MIYLDNAATTKMSLSAFNAYELACKEFWGNVSSQHDFGKSSNKLLDYAINTICNIINCKSNELIFTSGATESNNLAIKGVARAYKSETKNHIISVKTEHKCVLETVKSMKKEGFDITLLDVGHDGLISLEELEKSITDKTILVSVMGVNNEIGVIQPLKEIGEICKKHGVIFHTDCAQAYGKIPLDVNEMNIDLMSISGHKIYLSLTGANHPSKERWFAP